MKTVEVSCNHCGKTILKPQGEYNRRVRLKKNKFYCNNTCSGAVKENVERLSKIEKRYNISQHCDNHKDEYTNFRWYIKTMKNTNRKFNKKELDRNFNIDLEYLKELWKSQSGICPFTGELMELKTHSRFSKPAGPYTASIDRIDNTKGYEKGNIRFVSNMANIARNKFSDEDLILFCKKVSNFRL